MTALDVLTGARERIADIEHWTRTTLAVNAQDLTVPPNDSSACRWCALGAISAEADWWDYPACDGPEAQEALRYLAEALGLKTEAYEDLNALLGTAESMVYKVNDRHRGEPARSHEQILAAFDRAIEAAQTNQKEG